MKGGGGRSRCRLHPKEEFVGICPLCLNERLLILAAKQSSSSTTNTTSNTIISTRSRGCNHHESKTKKSLFGLGFLFCRRPKADEATDVFFDAAAADCDSTSTSFEDESFISIKFGDNGVASWDKGSSILSKVSLQNCSMSRGSHNSVKNVTTTTNTTTKVIGSNNNSRKSVVEHAKPRTLSLRWRKRIEQLLEVMRWKKSSKTGGGAAVQGTSRWRQ